VHHVRELAVFLHSHAGDQSFWHTWREAHSPSLRSLEAISFYYALTWFDCRLHPLAEQQIENLSPTRQSWLQCFSGSALEVMFRKNKDALWLQLSFIDSGVKRWQVIYRTLIQARVVFINSAAVRLRNRRLAPSFGNHRLRQYLAYLASRSAAHGWASLVTLVRGLHWLWSTRGLSNSFSRVGPNP
jgi:exonuclease V gamma subunit